MGDVDRALQNAEQLGMDTLHGLDMGNSDRALAYGSTLMQSGRPAEAIELLESWFAVCTDDGPRAALGGLLALAYAADGRADDALRTAASVEDVQGGTYSDRMWRRWGEGFACLQRGDTERGLAAIDDADAIAAETDSRVDQAIASLARAVALSSAGHPHAVAAREDAGGRLAALDITAAGWDTVFTMAAAHVAPSFSS
jgi:tetratricopeptide (TPR) repeat protein